MLLEFAVIAYVVVGAGLIAQGLRYLLASRVMHYHADVMNESWSQLKEGERRLMLGLLRGFGAGMLCLGVATVFSALVPLRGRIPMADWFLASTSVIYTGLLVQVTRSALLPGAAPIAVTGSMFALTVAAAVASFIAVP